MLAKKFSISCEEIGEKYDMSDMKDVPKSSHKKGMDTSRLLLASPFFFQVLHERPTFFVTFNLTGSTPSRLKKYSVFFFFLFSSVHHLF